MNDFIDKYENTLANIGAFIMTFLLMLFICSAAKASPKLHMDVTTQTIVLDRDGHGGWTSRLATVDEFDDGIIMACFKEPKVPYAQCFVLLKDNPKETVVVRVRLLGEENT